VNTNFLMLSELLSKYHPEQRGIVSAAEYELIMKTLCLKEMNVLALRNLRDFTVAHMSRSETLEDWDRMSAITYVIDSHIVELGGEV